MERFRKSWEAELISPYMRSLGVGLFTTRTVGELLWGYEDSLLRVAKKFWPQLDDVFGLFYKVSARFHSILASAAASGFIFPPFCHRATRPTMAATSSSRGSRTTETLPGWTRGTVKGSPLGSPTGFPLLKEADPSLFSHRMTSV